ncbi:MAG: CBS domain-containing protein, partial [Candidatus Limnocylindrales bacterium]
EEGILGGESCGTAIVAALDEAARLMRDEPSTTAAAVMVVLLPDGGRNYLSKLYNDEWLRANGLVGSATAPVRVAEALAARHADGALPAVVLARTTQTVAAAIDMLQRFGISQMPVSERADDAIDGIVGSISEKSLLDRAYHDPAIVERTVGEAMERPLPTIATSAALDEAFRLLSEGAPALVAVAEGRPAGIVSKLDLLEFLAHRGS